MKPLNGSTKSKYPRDVAVRSLVEELFLERWNTSAAYSEYYHRCAPKICTYTYMTQADFAYMITLLISLSGGLETILFFFTPLVVAFIMKRSCFRTTRSEAAANAVPENSPRKHQNFPYGEARPQSFRPF